MLLWSTVNVSAQNAALKNFPEGSQPQEVGDRIVNKFLKTPHTRFGNPRAEKAPDYITYPDACTWLGALWYAKATDNKLMTAGLVKRFEPLFSTEKHMLPRMVHVDYNVVGAVPLEIYIQKQGGQEYYDLGLISRKEYNKNMTELNHDMFDQAGESFDDMLQQQQDYINKLRDEFSAQEQALQDSWTVEDRKADWIFTQMQ